MLVLGLQGSPRLNGNTSLLLSAFMEEARMLGADTHTINVYGKNIQPCKELKECEINGCCPIEDDMNDEIYPFLWEADLIVMATPIFFYSAPAQLKALIDRMQTFWARRYILKLNDPGRKWRNGFVLALGATKGANLFEGLNLTARYFFDALGADFKGSLSYHKIENIGDIIKHPSAFNEARAKANELIKPYLKRKKVLFVCKGNACRSQMSQAFAAYYAGDRIEAMSAGDDPAADIDGLMVRVMAEKGIDMGFRKPKPIQDVARNNPPDIVVTMGCDVTCPAFPGAKVIEWDLPDPVGKSVDFFRNLRDDIEEKIKALINKIIL